MNNIKKMTLVLLSTSTLLLCFAGKGLSAEDTKEYLEQKLQSLKKENEQTNWLQVSKK